MKHDHNHEGEVNHTFEVPEQIKQGYARAKQHLKEHREAYLAGAGCLVLGYLSGNQLKRPVVIDFQPVINNMPTFNNHNIGNVVENTINNTGHLHKLVKRIRPDGTEEIFETITDAAEKLAPEYGIKAVSMLNRISKVANGHIPDYKDDQFVFVGTGTR